MEERTLKIRDGKYTDKNTTPLLTADEEVGACCVPTPAHVASLNPKRYRPSQQYE